MKRTLAVSIGLSLILSLAGSPAQAAKKEPAPIGEGRIGMGHFDRDHVLIGVTIVDGLTGAWTALELITGTSSGVANGLTIISAGPAIAFGAAVLNQNADDPALWVATIGAGAIFTVAAIDILRRHLAPDEKVRPSARRMILVPLIEPVPNERSTRVGLALAGTF
jgi:hypothetical protein